MPDLKTFLAYYGPFPPLDITAAAYRQYGDAIFEKGCIAELRALELKEVVGLAPLTKIETMASRLDYAWATQTPLDMTECIGNPVLQKMLCTLFDKVWETRRKIKMLQAANLLKWPEISIQNAELVVKLTEFTGETFAIKDAVASDLIELPKLVKITRSDGVTFPEKLLQGSWFFSPSRDLNIGYLQERAAKRAKKLDKAIQVRVDSNVPADKDNAAELESLKLLQAGLTLLQSESTDCFAQFFHACDAYDTHIYESARRLVWRFCAWKLKELAAAQQALAAITAYATDRVAINNVQLTRFYQCPLDWTPGFAYVDYYGTDLTTDLTPIMAKALPADHHIFLDFLGKTNRLIPQPYVDLYDELQGLLQIKEKGNTTSLAVIAAMKVHYQSTAPVTVPTIDNLDMA